MNNLWQLDLTSRPADVIALPPAMVEETAWDILLALHSDRACTLSIDKLASMVSAPLHVVTNWLALLEGRQLIAGMHVASGQDLLAVLTPPARDLLDRYLSLTNRLQSSSPS